MNPFHYLVCSIHVRYWKGKGKQETVELYFKKSSQVYKKTHKIGTLEVWNSLACKVIYIVWTEE